MRRSVRLRKGLFVFVDLPADVLGELLKDRVLSTQRVPWEQTKYQNGEECPCRDQADLKPLDEQRMIF